MVVTLVVVLIANGSLSGFGQRELAISGAPDYTTTTGESGRALAEGSPWGRPCQPIVFQVNSSMPAQQYALIEQSVDGARALGFDVTIESQNLFWYPSLLYPAGQTNATVRVVPIFPSTGTPPTLPDGHAERIGFGWDTKISPDGHHDVLTDLQATIYLGGRARRCPGHRAGHTATRCLQSGSGRLELSRLLDLHGQHGRGIQPTRSRGHASDVRVRTPADDAPRATYFIACRQGRT